MPLSSVISSNDLTKLNSSQSLALLTNLSSSSLDSDSQKALASNLPTNTSLSTVVSSAAYVPIQLITNTNSSQLASLISNMNLNDMTADKAAYIASQVSKSNDTSTIKSMLVNGNGNSKITNSVQLNVLNSQNTTSLTSLPANQLPTSFVRILTHFKFNIINSKIKILKKLFSYNNKPILH